MSWYDKVDLWKADLARQAKGLDFPLYLLDFLYGEDDSATIIQK